MQVQMKRRPTVVHASLCVAAWVGCALAFAQAPATEAASQPAHADSPLRAEIALLRSVVVPGQPIRARFTLINTGDEPISLPVQKAAGDDALALPLCIVFGTERDPALTLTYEGERPAALRPPSPIDGERTTIRLAPDASLGVGIDLRPLHKLLRYSGAHKLEWRPSGVTTAPVTVEFRIEPRKSAILATDYGKMTFQLAYDTAPRNVENFLELARDKFYDGTRFHRLIAGFLIQGGSPDGNPKATRPDGRTIVGEFTNEPFDAGVLAMSLRPGEPDSASCQFFIMLGRDASLDGKYTIIGRATDAESLRTLAELNSIATNERDEPLRPLPIRAIELRDVEPTSESAGSTRRP